MMLTAGIDAAEGNSNFLPAPVAAADGAAAGGAAPLAGGSAAMAAPSFKCQALARALTKPSNV